MLQTNVAPGVHRIEDAYTSWYLIEDEGGVPVYVHENDVPLTRHPRQCAHERARSHYLATQPRALP